MRIRVHLSALALAGALMFVHTASLPAQESPQTAKKKVTSASDLPRFSYPLSSPPSSFFMTDDATFNAFARSVLRDVNSVLHDYDIQDKATLRMLFATRLNVQMLTGENEAALDTISELRSLQEKPSAKAATGLLDRALIEARIASHSTSGDAFLQAFEARFKAGLNAVEWKLIQDRVKSIKGSFEIATADLMVGSEKQSLDRAAVSGSVDLPAAETMIEDRTFVKVVLPLKEHALPILTSYISAHNIHKPDIWAAREVTLSTDQKLTPVRIGIWDMGVDTSLFPDQLFVDPNPGAHSPHGLAFDMYGNPYNGDLQPITPEQKRNYPMMIGLQEGISDLYNNVDSPPAAEAKKMLSSMSPEQASEFMKQQGFVFQYIHGTHVAGIAVRGNPAARIVVIQFYDSLPEIPFAPTVEWANKFKSNFQQVGEYFRTNDVRVVNMSWADGEDEFEYWLTKTSSEKDPAIRKQLAQQIFAVWHDAVEGAIRKAPNTLFVCAAGNSNSDTSFDQSVPNSLHLPNLIAVGAVDQAGEETSFTSYGDTVVVHADGYQVESYVPGGAKLKFSGTSMASPNVANLAAKLIALDPSLTPQEVIDLIKRGADASADGRRHLINPKATVELLKARAGRN